MREIAVRRAGARQQAQTLLVQSQLQQKDATCAQTCPGVVMLLSDHSKEVMPVKVSAGTKCPAMAL